MRQTSITRFWSLLLLLLVATACSKEPAPNPTSVGTVALAATSNPATCGAAPSTCTLYPDKDTTVFSGATVQNTKDYGKGHEMCVGLTASSTNAVARPLLHFNLAALPSKAIVTSASLSVFGRRGSGTNITLNLWRLTSGSWSESSGTGAADGHNQGGCASATCSATGACGWAPASLPANGATYSNSNNVNIFVAAPITSNTFTVPTSGSATISWTGLATHVRAQAAGSNFGWTIRTPDETAANKVVFWSTDTATGDGNKPSLSLNYSRGPGSACTFDSDCVFSDGTSGDCAGGFCCTATCNDNKSCTTDSCNSSGTCSHTDVDANCNDSKSCTTDTCNPASGSANATTGCVITQVDAACSDGKTCTTDTCNPASGSANATTGCVITQVNAACNDSKSCTTDTCNPASGSANATTGCVNATNDAACNDSKSCTTDTCNPASGSADATTGCVLTPVDAVCNDSNGCTTDTCSPASGGANATTGCLIVNNSLPCDNGVFCDGTDTCSGGTCLLHSGNPCTVDPSDSNCATSCNEAMDACNAADPLGTGCNNGVFCDGTDTCNGSGSCLQHSGNPCSIITTDANCSTSCNEAADNCTAADPLGTGCNDGVFCDGTDTCNGSGSCAQHAGDPCLPLNTADANCSGSCNEGAKNCTANDPVSTGCNDNIFCDGTDTCNGSGSCAQHTGDPCLPLNTADANCAASCKEASKNCTAFDPDTTGCNDGKTCTTGELCHSGVCNGSSALDCSGSADQCHSGVCNEPGGCSASPLTGNSCDDSNACTSADKCQSGTCTGSTVNCNDGNPCTTDSCNSGSGCVHTNVADGTGCGSDSNVCTLDTCLAGVCHAPVANGTSCGVAASCSGTLPNAQATPAVTCSAGVCPAQNPVACGATTPCNAAGTACQGTCGADTDCPGGFYCDSNSHACTVQVGIGVACARTAMCSQAGQALTCVDSVCCTSACGGGVATDCQTCNGTSPGTCTSQTGTSCNDNVFCNGADTCAAGVCNVHVGDPCLPLNTTDGNCSTSCNEGAKNCTAADPASTGCTDGNACTTSDQCNGSGTCTGGAAPTCNDNNPCTNDSCAPATGCVFTVSNSNTCSDGDACTTGDHCSGGNCITSGPTNCNDNNPCTDDSCSSSSGCANVANTAPCNDNNACTTSDVCANKACAGGPALACDDKNPCTDDTCAPATGCVFTNDNANTCSDSNACTSSDHCLSGKCTGTTITCDDKNPCTDDSCDTSTGCIVANNTSACDDLNACTTSDRCASGKCVGGAAPTCNDGNPCTLDNCDPKTGCVFPAGNAGTQCRASAGICDPSESCDGTNVNCPANQFDKTTTCSGASCTNGTGTLAAICNGSGAACPTATQKACAPYTCGAKACLTVCAADTDCAPGNYCAAGGKCTAKGAIGASCSAGVQCLSSFCADGVCCNSDCTNQCEACNLPTSPGTCAAVQGKPVGSRPVCPGNATGCDGFCNGAVRTSCTLPGQNTECRPASCDASTSTATLREFCDGQGSCPGKRTQDCTPGICGATQCTGCSTNADCPKGDFCRGGVCKPLASNGTACSIDPECSSSHCVDGVCCDNDCTGQCEACNLPAAPGTCTAIDVGQPPATGRPQCNGAGTQCGGACDGTNRRACVYAGPGTVCRTAGCQNGVATLVGFCDGAGACPALDQVTCPKGSKCAGTLCAGGANTCSSDGDCNVNEYCAAGACVLKKHPGDTCNMASECNSSICVDGVCCTSACGGQCEACNLVGDEGSCLPVTGAPHGGRQPCATDGSVCGGACDGVTNDRCAYKGAETSCRDAQCHGGLADLPASCQGDGSCAPLQQQSCDPVGCDAEAITCAGPCKADNDCMTGQYCSASMCVAKLGNSSPCGGSNQCTNSHCVDGVCCDGACTGQCQSCDQAGSVGTCTAVPGAPRDGRPACPGSGACGGYCDGMDGMNCALPDANVTCGIEYCSESADTKAPKCNGSATCVIPLPASCDPYVCDPQSSTCRTSCDLDADCAPGLVCNNGGCTQPVVVPDAGMKKPDGGMGTIDASIGAGGASAGGGSSADGGSRGDGGSANGGQGGGSGAAGTGASGKAGGFGVPSPDGGVIPVDAGVDGGSRSSGKHNNEHDSGGCGCRVTNSGAPDGAGLALLALAATLLRRRRRTSHQTERGSRSL